MSCEALLSSWQQSTGNSGLSHRRHSGREKAASVWGTGPQEWTLQEVVGEAPARSTNAWSGCRFVTLARCGSGGSREQPLTSPWCSRTPSQFCALTALNQAGTWRPESCLDPPQAALSCPHAHAFSLGRASGIAPRSGSTQRALCFRPVLSRWRGGGMATLSLRKVRAGTVVPQVQRGSCSHRSAGSAGPQLRGGAGTEAPHSERNQWLCCLISTLAGPGLGPGLSGTERETGPVPLLAWPTSSRDLRLEPAEEAGRQGQSRRRN